MNSFASSFETGFEGIYGSWSFGFLSSEQSQFSSSTCYRNLFVQFGLQRIFKDYISGFLPLQNIVVEVSSPPPAAYGQGFKRRLNLWNRGQSLWHGIWHHGPKPSPAVADVYGPERLMGWEYIV